MSIKELRSYCLANGKCLIVRHGLLRGFSSDGSV